MIIITMKNFNYLNDDSTKERSGNKEGEREITLEPSTMMAPKVV